MLARISSGESGRPSGSVGFSRKARIRVGSSGTTSMTPNSVDIAIGCRMAATVTPAPDSTCCSTICEKSIRYTWSAPTTTTMSGFSSVIVLKLWKIASALPWYQDLSMRCWAGMGAT